MRILKFLRAKLDVHKRTQFLRATYSSFTIASETKFARAYTRAILSNHNSHHPELVDIPNKLRVHYEHGS